ncbi:RND superfamily putative drug exporter [Pullulanibacillus pueri]|uniref:Transporter n=1 Tax=Pullulanibacillus pueri TaxID=1437324 RepID=A0A8J3EKV7_9BACL|nr:MMPL family transporter [Pullulanibacillus pueri]MBM7680042.1 RND superfamily putative drug exporter [Pullulanibacillus pueri]GGH74076.1 transporter [Pullulanibacillus pueri]
MRLILKGKWFVLAAWIIAIVVLMVTQPDISALVRDKGNAEVPDGYSSSDASQLLDEWNKQSGGKDTSSVALVFYDKKGLDQKDNDAIKKGIQELKANQSKLGITEITNSFDTPSLKDQLISKNNKTMLVNVNISLGNKDTKKLTDDLYKTIKNVSVDHYYTSEWMINNDTMESTQDGLHKTEYLTVIFILLVLFIVFRSLIAPFLPLVAVGISFLASQAVVAFLVDWFNFPISNFTQIFLVAVLFGIGTDYCILLINRFKEEIPKHETLDDAIVHTFKNGGRTVFFSSIAVFIGFAAIGFSTFNIYQSAVGVAVGIAFLILSLVTIVPIIMSLLGTKLFWPVNKNLGHSQNKFWGGMGRFALARPLIALIIVAVITVPFLITYHGDRSFNSVGEMSDSYNSVKGFNLISDNFNPGEAMPTSIVLKNDENMNHREYLQTIEAITREVKKVNHVDTVRSATQPLGEPIKDFLVPNQAQTLDKGLNDANDGINKIADGLHDAGSQLADSGPQLKQATGGIDDLISGTQDLKKGVVQLQGGLQDIQGGIKQSASGAGDIKQHLQEAKDGAEELLTNSNKILEGYKQMQTGLTDIRSNYQKIYDGLKNLPNIRDAFQAYATEHPDAADDSYFKQGLGGLNALLNDQSNNSKNPSLLDGMKQLQDGLNQLNRSMTEANKGFATLLDNQKTFNQGLEQLIAGLDQLQAGLNKTADGQGQAIQNIPSITKGFDGVIGGQTQLKNGFSGLDDQMNQLVKGLDDSVDGLHQVSGGLDDASSFLNELSKSNSALSGFYIPDEALKNKDFTQSLDTYMSTDRKITKLDVVFDVNPYSQTALDQIDKVKAAVNRATEDTPLENVKVGIGGATSTFNDLSHISNKDYNHTVLLMLIGIGIVLIFLLRSLVMPIYIIGSLILTYYASMGMSEKIFEHFFGYAGINWAIPFFGFVMLVALGVDYSIFLMDRFNEYKDLPVREAILEAMKNMGSVILSAAIILGGTFAAMIPSGVTELMEIAMIIILGLIIYNLLILPLFIPVMVRTFGTANWWPFKRGE